MNIEETVDAARNGFEASFAETGFYNRQTRDEAHLDAIIGFIPAGAGMRILDLGAGSGYLSFALAKKYPEVSVVGLDIVEKALDENRKKAENEGLSNIGFVSYGGVMLPFADNEFDIVVSRYSLHHFPDIEKSVEEVFRVLKSPGCFFISDPAPDEADTDGAIDRYMQVKADGHIRFYSLDDWKRLCGNCGFRYSRSFVSSIRFPRKNEDAYREVIAKYGDMLVTHYDLKITDGEIFVTEQVNNILFEKQA